MLFVVSGVAGLDGLLLWKEEERRMDGGRDATGCDGDEGEVGVA